MSLRRTALGVVGVVTVLLAALAVFAPTLVLSLPVVAGVVDWLATTTLRILLAACGLLLGLAVLALARPWSDSTDGSDHEADRRMQRVRDAPPETVTADRRVLAGAFLDGRVEAAIDGDEEALGAVRTRLSEVATAVLVADGEVDRPDAERAVASGEWTDDRTAAAFLAEETDGPRVPILARVRLWLDPETERERRVDRTVAAIERLRGGRS